MDETMDLGTVRNLLAGLRCPELHCIDAPDEVDVRVMTAYERTRGRGPNQYVFAVEIPKSPNRSPFTVDRSPFTIDRSPFTVDRSPSLNRPR